MSEYEDLVRKLVAEELRRGKISLFISSPDPSVFSSRLVLNETLAKEVQQKIRRLKKVLKTQSGPDDSQVWREVLRYPEVLTKDFTSSRTDIFGKQISKAVSLALKNLTASRIAEGASLEKDLLHRLAEIRKALGAIEKRLPVVKENYRKSLQSRMKEYLKNGELDKERVTVEVAQFAKNSDISEEVTRLKTHVDAMKRSLRETGELGRKIDFIAQEMTRETNTIGSKSGDTVIARQVIGLKSAIEKIREQSQNVE